MKRFILYILLLFLITSCASVNFYTIDIQKPAQVVLPASIKNIVIVNNAAVQPSNVGHGTDASGNALQVSSDSVNIILTQALGQFMNDEHFFENVSVFNEALRANAFFLAEEVMSTDKIQEIATKTNADAIVSLDRIVMASAQSATRAEYSLFVDNLQVKADVKLRVYDSSGKRLLPAIESVDSLFWTGIRSGDYYIEHLPPREDALKKTALYMADNVTKIFIPYWREVERFYYTDGSTKMKQAAVKMSAREWRDAALIWGELYESEQNKVKQVKLASNIAMANEMLDDLENALTWINIAEETLAQTNKSDKDDLVVFTRSYKTELEERLIDFRKLDLQQGTDSTGK